MMKKRIMVLCATLLSLSLMAGCSGSSSDSYAATSDRMAVWGETAEAPAAEYPDSGGFGFAAADDYDVMYDEDMAIEEAEIAIDVPEDPETGGGEADIEAIAGQPRKIVYNVDVSLQTTDFDEGVNTIPAMAESMGGFVQGSYVQNADMNQKYYNRSASFTLRIPADQLDALMTRLTGSFHLLSQQKYSNDITANYYDTQARLDSLRIQEERLTSMLESAEELQYLLEVERELANVRWQLESLTTALNRMDNQVNYSTVTVYLEEVSAYEDEQPAIRPVTFGERMEEALGDSWNGFVRFWQNLLLFFIALLPFLPVIVIIVVVVVVLVRRNKKKAPKRSRPPIYPQLPNDETKAGQAPDETENRE